MSWLMLIVAVVVFPGFLFTAALGLFSSWVDRKLSARLQFRVDRPGISPWRTSSS